MARTPSDQKTRQSGFAILLVVFIVALASILVVNLTYSQTLGSRLNAMTVQSFQAEYMLKSALNFSRRLLEAPKPDEEGAKAPWTLFENGAAIPGEYLGITEQNVLLELQIRPLDANLWVQELALNSSTQKWIEVFYNLCEQLGFDNDNEADQSGPFKGKVLKCDEITGALIDYTDPDKESFQGADYARGVEGGLAEDAFPNEKLSSLEELKGVPGFTPRRLARLMPLLRVGGQPLVNINYAPREVLKALDREIDDQVVDRIIQERRERPFTPEEFRTTLKTIMGETRYNKIQGLVTAESSRYQVLSKVDFSGGARYFLRAIVFSRGSGPDAHFQVLTPEFY